jgi:High potential iron-sulfur protein
VSRRPNPDPDFFFTMAARGDNATMTTRRRFIQIVPLATGAALCGAGTAGAQANLLSEKDATAVNLGYVADASKADKAKYKTWAAGQACSNCALFQGKATDAAAACPLFAGKVVTSKGWCSAYAKKAA